MKAQGEIDSITKVDGGSTIIRLKDNLIKFDSRSCEGIKVGKKVNILYKVMVGKNQVEEISDYTPPELTQREKDINASVVLKILSELVCSGKLRNNKEDLIAEGKHWLKVQKELRI